MVAAPRHYKQSVELLEQVFGPATFLNQAGPLGPLNPALYRIFVEAVEHIVQVRTQIQPMQKECCRGPKGDRVTGLAEISMDWTKFEIPPFLMF